VDLDTSQALELLRATHAVDALVPVETDPLTLLRAAEELTGCTRSRTSRPDRRC
jgi:hypothetical protein